MNKRCKFKEGKWNCGSYAFNLYKDDIDQGDLCDVHYWQDQAMKAAAHEREACWRTAENYDTGYEAAEAIRARGTT